MPNLRKKSSVLTYNDDAIYRAIENQRTMSHGTKKISKRPDTVLKDDDKGVAVMEGDHKIPEFVYADDGRKFFPCLFCCHAFAYKELQVAHVQQCTFRVTTESPPLKKTSSKMRNPSKSKGPLIRCRKENGQQGKTISKSQQFKLNPKLLVQKSKHLDSNFVIRNNYTKNVKELPAATAFQKIKLEPVTEDQNKFIKSTNQHPQLPNQNIKLVKSTNLQPHIPRPNIKPTNHPSQLPNESNKFIKPQISRNIKHKVSACSHCNIAFESAAKLLQHKRERHMFPKVYVPIEKLKEYDDMYKKSDMSKCTLCFKPVPKIRWYRHLHTHVDEKKYSCSICKKSFARKDHRDVHEKKHISSLINSSNTA